MLKYSDFITISQVPLIQQISVYSFSELCKVIIEHYIPSLNGKSEPVTSNEDYHKNSFTTPTSRMHKIPDPVLIAS